MEDLQIIRRKRSNSTSFKANPNPIMSLKFPVGAFLFNVAASKMIGFSTMKAYMFALSKKDGCVYLFEEEPEEDSYYFNQKENEGYRITCKDLATHFDEFFNDLETKSYFSVEQATTEGAFIIKPTNEKEQPTKQTPSSIHRLT